MGFIGDTIESIRSMQVRQVLAQIISLGSESPVVVVLSGSMEPGFKRGDILFLHMSKDPIRTGEIVVFNVDGREIPIVHRVIKAITILEMIDFCMHMGSFGFSNITLWDEL
uniref:Signal peptidase complex catalytic subunit SEC11 n=1 Tax=Leersia perrieri TaxID=77586 RepID=A0A0D9WP66_9ORYZ